MRMAECSYPIQKRDSILADVLTVRFGVGFAIRASGREDDLGSCHQRAVSVVGLDVDLEYRRRCRRELASADWKVSPSLSFHPVYGHASLESKLLNISWFHRQPLIQSTPERTAIFVGLTFVVALLSYARFVVLVINDITNYLGIACLTVRKKDERGSWHRSSSWDQIKKQD